MSNNAFYLSLQGRERLFLRLNSNVLRLTSERHTLAPPPHQDLRISGLGMNGGWKAFAIRPTVGGPPQQLGFPRLRVCHVALNVMTMGFQRCAVALPP